MTRLILLGMAVIYRSKVENDDGTFSGPVTELLTGISGEVQAKDLPDELANQLAAFVVVRDKKRRGLPMDTPVQLGDIQ